MSSRRNQYTSRREFLKIAGTAVGGLAISGLVSCAPSPGATPGEAEELILSIWSWHPEIVQDNIKKFEEQTGIKTNVSVVTGDYNTVMEVKILTKTPLDICYAFPDRANRWYRMGGLLDLDDMPEITNLVNDMYPYVKEAVTAYDGKVFCLPYGILSIPLHTNEKLLREAGLEGEYPQTWDEMLEQCKTIKSKGLVDYPYLPRWEKTSFGVTWALWVQCLSEGEELFDKDSNPVFDTNTPIMGVLENWVKFWEAGLVPESVLAATETDVLNSWKGGQHAYTLQDDYYVRDFNDPEQSKIAGYSSYAPRIPGATHEYMLVPLEYVVQNRERSKEHLDNLWNLLKFLAWKDEEGIYWVPERFAKDFALVASYPKVFEAEDVRQAYLDSFMRPEDLDTLLNVYQSAKLPNAFKGELWYPEWDVKAQDLLQEAIQGIIPAEQVVTQLRELALELKEQYA